MPDSNLFEPKLEQFDKFKRVFLESFTNLIESEKFEQEIKAKIKDFYEIFQDLSKNQISPEDFFLKCFNMLSK